MLFCRSPVFSDGILVKHLVFNLEKESDSFEQQDQI